MRDLRMIAFKLQYVMMPKSKEDGLDKLRDWDLWGPLFLCLMLALTLGMQPNSNSSSLFGKSSNWL